MYIIKMDIKLRMEMCLEDSLVRYIIIYKNDKIVQGYHLYSR